MSSLGKQSLMPLLLKRSLTPHKSDFIPKHAPVENHNVQSLANFINDSKKILILTGAGISTESGIPDYRSEGVGLYARSNHRPVQYQDFLKSETVRQRYWARNYIGWPNFSKSQPNITHYVVHFLQNIGKVSSVVTQNVDGLHLKAGSTNVIELHGTAFRVICLKCGKNFDRHFIQEKMNLLNPGIKNSTKSIRPDGDVDVQQDMIEHFKPPICDHCNGILKPDITFFGDNVPKERVDAVRNNVNASDSVIVLGSSLSVFSGYRIVLQAHEEKKKLAIVNIGATRADEFANLKISARCGDILSKIVSEIDLEV